MYEYVYYFILDSLNRRSIEMLRIYMYISCIQIHGTAELWKRGEPCTCIEYTNIYICGTMETWNCVYMIDVAYITLCKYTTTEPWKCGTMYT